MSEFSERVWKLIMYGTGGRKLAADGIRLEIETLEYKMSDMRVEIDSLVEALNCLLRDPEPLTCFLAKFPDPIQRREAMETLVRNAKPIDILESSKAHLPILQQQINALKDEIANMERASQ